MNIPQCQGGWCTRRERCAHYHAPMLAYLRPADRLCEPGQSDAFQSIAVYRVIEEKQKQEPQPA